MGWNSKNDGIWLPFVLTAFVVFFALGISIGKDILSIVLFMAVCFVLIVLRRRYKKGAKHGDDANNVELNKRDNEKI